MGSHIFSCILRAAMTAPSVGLFGERTATYARSARIERAALEKFARMGEDCRDAA